MKELKPDKSKYVVVIGGFNIDIGGISTEKLVPGDSNPGTITITMGGVGRNIAENLARLGAKVYMLTAIGEDANGTLAKTQSREDGIDLDFALVVPDKATSTYLYISDSDRDMNVAINDMGIVDCITPEYIKKNLALLNSAAAVVIDMNLSEDTVKFIGENVTAPIFCDAVSYAKCDKMLPIADKLYALKPNRIEAEKLSGISINDKEDALRAAHKLVSMGIKHVFITMSGDGAVYSSEFESTVMDTPETNPVDATGCGDAFTSGIVWNYLMGYPDTSALAVAMGAAAVTFEAQGANAKDLSGQKIFEKIWKD